MRIHPPALAALLLLSIGATLVAVPAATAAPAPASASASAPSVAAAVPSPVAALDRSAHPLRSTSPQGDLDDLRALGRMVGDAQVVGLGEATHSSHEFFTLKHRVFRYLVAEKGFRTFALEGSWSAGLRLNDYVLHGTGSLRQIMDEEFQSVYASWNTAEYRDLVLWMRSYNVQHPDDPVRFMGNDSAYAGPQLYDQVHAYAARTSPELAARLAALYQGLRPATSVDQYITTYLAQPLAARQARAARTTRAVALLARQRPGPGEDGAAYRWAVQQATAIDQMARLFAYDDHDPQEMAASMRYRDSVMAANVVWWQQRTGSKILLAAHNAHVALQTYTPATYPKVQGTFLREALGDRYVSVATTFDRGAFNATGPDGVMRKVTVGAARPGSTEYTLDQVRARDFVVDLRSAPPAARAWLATARPVKLIGTAYPAPNTEPRVALAGTHDLLIHLHQVTAATLLTSPTGRR
ncbi:erythromycin esterase family protein [Streptomyces sp. NPDC006733]|uniref:erythromycin esterase family protein n=1 Tax=Streptomyces sp. NPDC006733 TaxID=3155460 RepID=UPI003406E853